LRQIIPWERIVQRLSKFYDEKQGPIGKSLRMMIALQIIKHYYELSDQDVIKSVKENRYIQYFCNVADQGLATFLHPTSLHVFRVRLGIEGTKIIESETFHLFRRNGVINGETALIDSSVLESDIIHPNDVELLFKAFAKMVNFANQNKIPLWWDQEYIQQLWREFNLGKRANRERWLIVFFFLFVPALAIFKTHIDSLPISDNPKKKKYLKQKEKAEQLFQLLSLLGEQTVEKLDGKISIANRIVSLDEIDARPIKKGKIYPSCEFGTTMQMSFNRDGFMITIENFIGQPGDQACFPRTLSLFIEKMKENPDILVTDLGYRSKDNLKKASEKVKHAFLGKSSDVTESMQDFCRRARSATEGFIAVAKHCRGFGRSLYKGLIGDSIWSVLSQTAYNLKKFIQLWQKEKITEDSLVKLGLLG